MKKKMTGKAQPGQAMSLPAVPADPHADPAHHRENKKHGMPRGCAPGPDYGGAGAADDSHLGANEERC